MDFNGECSLPGDKGTVKPPVTPEGGGDNTQSEIILEILKLLTLLLLF